MTESPDDIPHIKPPNPITEQGQKDVAEAREAMNDTEGIGLIEQNVWQKMVPDTVASITSQINSHDPEQVRLGQDKLKKIRFNAALDSLIGSDSARRAILAGLQATGIIDEMFDEETKKEATDYIKKMGWDKK